MIQGMYHLGLARMINGWILGDANALPVRTKEGPW